jgi:hypothetical protein
LNAAAYPAYQHTQPGTLLRGVLLVVGVLEGVTLLGWLLDDRQSWSSLAPMPVLLLILAASYLLFGSMTVAVDREHLRLAFGLGIVHRNIPIRDIIECQPVRNAWWYGWGIRRTPHGWLWNVSGLDAVELTYRSGKRFRVGTDEPHRLCAAISASIAGTTPSR